MKNISNHTATEIALGSATRAYLPRLSVIGLAGMAFLLLPQDARADYTAKLSGDTVTFTSDGTSDTLILGQEGGLLTHSCYAKGNAGFSSATDLDSTQPGEQTLSLTQVRTIVINGGDGNDTLIIDNPPGSVF